ncbi:MarR family winged helix-turn-helix transcriptional regulator [Solitalea sp. MAHUQ-68]|uniref:MarR family winged helix-turn-helix transcriptional regulator n=1 Tax=Solitalea agri TaxID=2953739 RepID=A0A9X2JAK1_9SPHI|nr:MarR family winged helix-turn-helix transcriptional regulator [Solitalea agri]MCO4291517.1 MarR family winged helix-turn-helix transcriptional regulator [Solitalea agri]
MKELLKGQLEQLKDLRKKSLSRTVHNLRMHLSSRLTKRIHEMGYPSCSFQHTAIFANIDIEGTNIVTLADRANISKQAMSKLVKDIEEMGYVETIKDPKDSRALLVILTDLGAELIINVQSCIKEIKDEVESVISKDKLDTFMSIATEINEYFDQDNRSEKGYKVQ